MNSYNDLYQKMQDPQILLTFKGSVSFELVNSLLHSLEPKLNKLESHVTTRKRLYNILVECLQNIVHHSADVVHDTEELRNQATVLMVTSDEGMYNVQTGNIILNNKIPALKDLIDNINSMSALELKREYKQLLDNNEFSAKGTAGLGFIDIARKSGKKLKCDFTKITEQYSVFSFSIDVPKGE